jgi:hypothetical protein
LILLILYVGLPAVSHPATRKRASAVREYAPLGGARSAAGIER